MQRTSHGLYAFGFQANLLERNRTSREQEKPALDLYDMPSGHLSADSYHVGFPRGRRSHE